MNMKQMRKISIVWGFFLAAIVISLTAIGFLYKNKSSDYKKLETNLITAGKKYADEKFLYPDANQSIKISYETMKSDGYMEFLKKEEEECSGYVKVINNNSIFEYKGFVKCEKYTTKDYEK